ncbi:MAG: prephenate dehydrogenase/arogenate dehydrogenase family protein, partial [Candidatus Eisenbacteria bacterium]|nr:prephenate dehydrogenase/arogenate dehydrogenase family protein [Candidatus Eisenbacteria bacterium]
MKAVGRRAFIVGLGQMGGSLAHDLAALGWEVSGYDRDPECINAARDAGVIHAIGASAVAAPAGAALIVLAVPARQVLELLPDLAQAVPRDVAVIDLAGTQGAILDRVAQLGAPAGYISAHPMAGGEQGGFSAALPGIYRGATFVLTPAPTARSAHIAAAEDLVQSVGARSLRLDAAEHDAAIALTSQLPHALAAALTRLAGRRRNDLPVDPLIAGSFRSATRVAARRPAVTLDMFLTNR